MPFSGRSPGKRRPPRDRAVHSQTGSQKTHTRSSLLKTPEAEPPRTPWEKRGNRTEDSAGEVAAENRCPAPEGQAAEVWPSVPRVAGGGPHVRRTIAPMAHPGGWGAPARGLRERLSGARGSRCTSQHLLDLSSESCSGE